MAITIAHLTHLIDGTDRTSYTLPSATFTAGRVYILGIINSKASAPESIVSITNSHIPTWTIPGAGSMTFGTAASPLRRISHAVGVATSTGTSTTVVAFSGTHTAAIASIDEAQGADTTDPIVTNAVGTAADTGLSYSVTRSIAGSVNAMLAVFGHNGGAANPITLTAPLTELYNNGGGTPTSHIAVGWAIGSSAANPACTSTANRQWGGTAFVLRALAVTGHPQFYTRRRQLQGAM